jgi:rod shape-determining protein MreD
VLAVAKPTEGTTAAYRFHPAAFWISLFVGMLLQVSLPLKIPLARLFDFPLVLTIYFALVRRSQIFGIVLGTGLGLLQDAFAHGLIGLFGIAKALVGYLAASTSLKFEMDRLGARYVLTGFLVCLHRLMIAGLERLLFEAPPPFLPIEVASAVVVNVALAVMCFQILDRFRRPIN